jgi:hypothetical protein
MVTGIKYAIPISPSVVSAAMTGFEKIASRETCGNDKDNFHTLM